MAQAKEKTKNMSSQPPIEEARGNMTAGADKIILDLCGGTGAWSKPYKDAGYDVRTITLPDHDVLTYRPPENVYGILAAPPCTQFSYVLSEKIPRDLEEGLKTVRACQDIIEDADSVSACFEFSAIENPFGHLNKFLGRPTFIFQPWEFGDPWTKRTGIWGDFNHPFKTFTDWSDVKKNPNLYIRPGRKKPNMVWLHKSAQRSIPSLAAFDPVDNDAAFRAMTPQGFAQAFFEANP